MSGNTGVLMLQDLAPQWLPGNGLKGEKSLVMVTEGVRGMVRVVLSSLVTSRARVS